MEQEHSLLFKIVAVAVSPIAYAGWFLACFLESAFHVDFNKALPLCWLGICGLLLVVLILHRISEIEFRGDPDDNE